MRQSWQDLLFAHWRVEADALRPLIPRGLELETFDGSCWLGVVPFWMEGVAWRRLPPLPGAGAFCELNVRTYVRCGETSGVYFFSLDAANRLAVAAARALFSLPYYYAKMRIERRGEQIDYRSRRTIGDAEFVGSYSPVGEMYTAQPGTLDHFLTERYRLFAERRGRIVRADVHHQPWPLQPATAEIEVNTVSRPLGVILDGPPETFHYAARVDVVVWNPKVVDSPEPAGG